MVRELLLNADMAQKLEELAYIGDVALTKAAEEIKPYRDLANVTTSLAKQAADELVRFGRIPPGAVDKAAVELRDPVRALQILIQAANPDIMSMPKKAGDVRGDDRSGSPDVRDSDRAWNEELGLTNQGVG
jgi:hypothetical protein